MRFRNKKQPQATATTLIKNKTVSGQQLSEEEAFYKEKGNKITEKLKKYDDKYDNKKLIQTFAIAVAGIAILSFAFQLRIIPIIIISIACLVVAPQILVALSEDRYEEKKFQDTTSYIEQMLYSFRRNTKILSSLEDTILLFPEGEMHDAIAEAIDYIRTSASSGNIYEEAFQIIEEHYNCRRIKSLHRYLVRVEGVGGDQDMGIQALINDRRIWIDRIEKFKKEKAAIIKDVIIATVFSSIVSVITLYMLPSYVDAPHHPIIQAYATFYIVVNLLNIKATINRLILRINDIADEEHDKRMLRKLKWYKTYDRVKEQKAAIKFIIIGVVFCIVGFLLTGISRWGAIGMGIFIALFGFFVQPRLKYNNTKKELMREIETVFPDWLLELSLLLQTDNLHVALEKTIPTAPLLIRKELRTLSEAIINDPTDVQPFLNFFSYLPLDNIHSSMKLLFSISEFGAADEQKQIAELIERNSILMNKAEDYKNQSRLARVFMLKFVPMGTSTLKMIVDMGVFLVIFITQALDKAMM